MASQSGFVVENKFTKGLITQSTAINTPDDCCTDTVNCVFNEFGLVTRRPGIDFETSYAVANLSPTAGDVYQEYVWYTNAESSNKAFVVQQVGDALILYDITSSINVSGNFAGIVFDLSALVPSGGSLDPSFYYCQFSTGNGSLLVVNQATDPFVLDWDGTNVNLTVITLKHRDTDGIDDGFGVDTRVVSSLSGLQTNYPKHFYNLLNQGWYNGSAATGLSEWDTAFTTMPSNADVYFYYRSGTAPFQLDTDKAANINPGKSPAPKGHFILNVGQDDRAAALTAEGYATVTIPAVNNYNRPRCVAFFAGRAWYAGIDGPTTNGKLFFSQVVTDNTKYGLCYQANDPTSEKLADLLATDGGVIQVPEMGKVQRLFPFQSQLLVFADNGVWLVRGNGNDGFAATAYRIQRISNIGMYSPLSVVDVRGLPMWWAEDGIYTISYDANYDSTTIKSLTEETIKDFILAVPRDNRPYIKGCFDILNNYVYWAYNHNTGLNATGHQIYNDFLVFNVKTSAFFPWSTDNSSGTTASIHGMVYVADGDRLGNYAIKMPTTFVTGGATKLTYSEFSDQTTWKDWKKHHDDYGVSQIDYTSYVIASYRLDTQAMRNFTNKYIWTFMESQENSSLIMKGLWDFTNNASSGKWSTPQQVYNSLTTRGRQYDDVRITRRIIRGTGKALQINFVAESGKPFRLIGWGLFQSGNDAP